MKIAIGSVSSFHPFARDFQDFSRRYPGSKLQLYLVVTCWDLDLSANGPLENIEWILVHQVIAFRREIGILFNLYRNNEIAVRGAAKTDIPLSSDGKT